MTTMLRVQAGAALESLLDLVLPRRCVVCGAAGAWLCDVCAVELRPLPDDRCRRCGAPQERAGRPARRRTGARRLPACRECVGRELAFSSVTAAYCYEGPARALVTACKFRALRSLADEVGERAAAAFGPAAARAGAGAVVTSVPAHRDHRCERGFDLAESLAQRLAEGAGLAYDPLLRRRRSGARQSGLGRAARAANVHEAFALRAPDLRVGTGFKRVIIVDDVYTTGETLNQCAQALAAVSADVHVFTFARAVRSTARGRAIRDHVSKE